MFVVARRLRGSDWFLVIDSYTRGMATRGSAPADGTIARLPHVVPFDIPQVTRLSWELGARVVGDDSAVRLGTWERTTGSWTLALFRVTSETVVVRLETPTGRERFYGAAETDIESVRPALLSAPEWNRRT